MQDPGSMTARLEKRSDLDTFSMRDADRWYYCTSWLRSRFSYGKLSNVV